MPKMRLRNDSKANQGVWTDAGLVSIEPGKTATVNVRDDYVGRVDALPFLVDVDAEARATEAVAKAKAKRDVEIAAKAKEGPTGPVGLAGPVGTVGVKTDDAPKGRATR